MCGCTYSFAPTFRHEREHTRTYPSRTLLVHFTYTHNSHSQYTLSHACTHSHTQTHRCARTHAHKHVNIYQRNNGADADPHATHMQTARTRARTHKHEHISARTKHRNTLHACSACSFRGRAHSRAQALEHIAQARNDTRHAPYLNRTHKTRTLQRTHSIQLV
jgi:hypothetical protein